MTVDDDDEVAVCFRAKEVWGSLENVKKEKNKLSKLGGNKHRRCECMSSMIFLCWIISLVMLRWYFATCCLFHCVSVPPRP